MHYKYILHSQLSIYDRMKPNPILVIVYIFIFAGNVNASPRDIQDSEILMLPKYCPYTQSFKYGSGVTNPSPEARRWITVMGDSFWHVHHYCWAMIEINRANNVRTKASEKAALRGSAIGNLNYTINNSAKDFVLLPEIYTTLGKVYIQTRSFIEAGKAFGKAREIKPDYWPPYYHWGEYLYSAGNKEEAYRVVMAGLEYSPKTETLRRLFKVLGGNPETIVPHSETNLQSPALDTAGSNMKAAE